MSFNIRYSGAKDGINCWANRKPLVAAILEHYKPDIIGFQEVMADQLLDLQQMLPAYHHVGVGRDDGASSGEFCPIFFRTGEPIDHGTFWLSATPDVPSKSWGRLPRICTWIRFKDPQPWVFANTHLDLTKDARLRAIYLFGQKFPQLRAGGPLFLTGDFNFGPKYKEYHEMSKVVHDAFKIKVPDGDNKTLTYHQYYGVRYPKWSHRDLLRIDYVWYLPPAEILSTKIIMDQPGSNPAIYPSDHWQVIADVSISNS